ncbi:hypothetical protein [Pseudoxanthomonas sp. SGT-18]|uniref:hypothetical protein n=1 Tax=Pseudoxanthomonas sp. SGT-18 TaxID=2493087 RepID=UPI0013DE1E85|nr:hypothetical protein [Pseudoxanthomonas sp. SGT-18]
MPQGIACPADAGDVAVRFEAAQHLAGLRIDLVEAAALVFAHPQVAVGPGHAGVAFAGTARRGDGVQHRAGIGVDLLDAGFHQLVEVGAVERGAGVAGALDHPLGLAAVRIERDQARAQGGPYPAAVEAHAVHAFGILERPVFADHFGLVLDRPGGGADVHALPRSCAPGVAPWS